jgi:hypothetical protein
MFCNACGRELRPGEQYCSACGQPVGVAPIPRSINRVAHHVQLLGVLWIVYSFFDLIGGITVMVFPTMILSILSRVEGVPSQIPGFLLPLFIAIGMFLTLKAVLEIGAGVGLLQRQPWARILALGLGIIALINIPFGLALGVYTLWTLFNPESQKEYESMAKK